MRSLSPSLALQPSRGRHYVFTFGLKQDEEDEARLQIVGEEEQKRGRASAVAVRPDCPSQSERVCGVESPLLTTCASTSSALQQSPLLFSLLPPPTLHSSF